MILPDSTIWIDHLRRANPALRELLRTERVLCHPFVIGEVGLGSLANRALFLSKLNDLPRSREASPKQVATLIEARQLWGRGIGYVDAHLLASAAITPGAVLWTRDKRLEAQAERLGIAYRP